MNEWLKAGLTVTAIVAVSFAFLCGLDWLVGPRHVKAEPIPECASWTDEHWLNMTEFGLRYQVWGKTCAAYKEKQT